MELSETAEELLEALWIRTHEEDTEGLGEDELVEEQVEVANQLVEGRYVSRSGSQLQLTDAGDEMGRQVVRRHRLAERLFSDVLSTHDMAMHEKACKLEHMIDRDLDENICTLLGHPKVCPHGKLIPPGRCCLRNARRPHRAIFPLSRLDPDQKAKIAYLYAPEESEQLQKLLSMGVLPGAPIHVVQTFPSYVFELGQTQFAIDKEVADSIFVRRVENGEGSPRVSTSPPARGRGFRRRLRRFGRS
jgi:DtxR family Mn-dependent transcriptional regulator